MQAARETLYNLIKGSDFTFKQVAEQIGERPDTLSTRLKHPERPGYGILDTAMVVNICAVLKLPLSEFFTRVEERAAEILQSQG